MRVIYGINRKGKLAKRGPKRDVVNLCRPKAPLVKRVQMRGEVGVAGSQPMSTAVHIKSHGAQINFGDLPPYLTHAGKQRKCKAAKIVKRAYSSIC
jgi:hypothetical protein